MQNADKEKSRIRRDYIFLGFSLAFLFLVIYFLKIEPDFRNRDTDKREKKGILINDASYVKKCPQLDKEKASKLIKLSLDCTNREYPNKPNYVFESDDDLTPPRMNTPAFFGCFDWHSAVHGHWSMVRILNRYPDINNGSEIKKRLTEDLSQENILNEIEFFKKKRNRLFERPYGWGWLLRLAAELKRSNDPELRIIYKNIEPFSAFIANSFIGYLNQLSRPIREGTHQNTAFSMIHLYDYLKAVNAIDYLNEVILRATFFYYSDEDCPVNYEPSGEDFISPCLAEADLMRRILPQEQFLKWFDRFMTDEKLKASLKPVEIINPEDPRIGHLIGLFYQRAGSLDGIMSALPENDYRRPFFETIIDMNCAKAEEYIEKSGYGGEHWLASFAIFFYTKATIK